MAKPVILTVDDDLEVLCLRKEINNGRRTIPTIFFEDGSTLFEPTNEELAQKLD